jgi:hypothetical protein
MPDEVFGPSYAPTFAFHPLDVSDSSSVLRSGDEACVSLTNGHSGPEKQARISTVRQRPIRYSLPMLHDESCGDHTGVDDCAHNRRPNRPPSRCCCSARLSYCRPCCLGLIDDC